MITELTPERQAIIDECYEEWHSVGLSTEPADFAKARSAITDLYKWGGYSEPTFIELSSPMMAELFLNLIRDQLARQLEGELARQLLVQLRGQLRGQLARQLGGQLGDQLGDQLEGELGDHKLKFTGTWFTGSWDSYLWGWADGGRRLGVRYEKKAARGLEIHKDISRSVGWFYSYENLCIVTDRPDAIRFDDRGLMHCENGPAIRYRDGYSLYAWHGVRVPGEWIVDKISLSPQAALTWKNVEQRRAACEILGWATILKELNASTIDKDADPQIGELVDVDIPEIGREKFLRVLCGTGREFALPVPPDMSTALQANAWTYGIEPDFYKPEVRT